MGHMKIISMHCLVSASLWVQANQIQVQVCSYRWGYALGEKPWLIPRQGFFPPNPLISGQWHVPPTSLVPRSQPLVSPWHRLCRVGRWEQGQALATALAETLWAAGGGGRAVVCLISAPITMMPREGYRANSFTERVSMERSSANGIFLKDTFGLEHRSCYTFSLTYIAPQTVITPDSGLGAACDTSTSPSPKTHLPSPARRRIPSTQSCSPEPLHRARAHGWGRGRANLCIVLSLD